MFFFCCLIHFCLLFGYWENVGEYDLGSEILKYVNISGFYCISPYPKGKPYVFVSGNFWYVEIEYYLYIFNICWLATNCVIWNSKLYEWFRFLLYCIFLASKQKSNTYFVCWYLIFGNWAGVSGGTASGKTTVCDRIIQQLHDHRVVLVNQVNMIAAVH